MKESKWSATHFRALKLLLFAGALTNNSFAAPGGVDLSFDPGSGVTGQVETVAVQPDGRMIIGGAFPMVKGLMRDRIARLNADGSGDSSFDPGTGLYGDVRAVALQSDGKVLVGHARGIARLNSNGTPDTNFVIPTFLNNETAGINAIAIQPDGRIIIGGYFYAGTGANAHIDIARLNSDGTFDNSFHVGTFLAGVEAVILQADGKMLIGGHFTTFNGTNRNGIARLNINGSLDSSFDPGTGANGGVLSMALQDDGKVLIGGRFTSIDGTNRSQIARLNPNGSVDPAFNTIFTNDPVIGVNAIAVQPDAKILIGGSISGMATTNTLSRLNADGSPDANFNCTPSGSVFAIVLQANGKTLIAGSFSTINGENCNKIAQLHADGGFDSSLDFGSGVSFPVDSVVAAPNGKTLIGNAFTFINGTNQYARARLNEDGTTDDTFIASIFNPDIGAVSGEFDYNVPTCVAVQPDGKVLAGGFTVHYECDPEGCYLFNIYFLNRINANGSSDTTFQPATGASNSDSSVESVAVQPDGKVLVAGSFTSIKSTNGSGVARLNANGTLDAGFNAGTLAPVYAIALQPDGKALIGGAFTHVSGTLRNGIARLNPNGTLDNNFDPGTGVNGTVFSVALQPDGKVLIGGEFTNVNGTDRNRIARLNTDGSLDTSFNSGSGPDGVVRSIALQPDGKVLIGGDFTTVNGVVRPRVARLLGDSTQPPGSFAGWAAGFGLSGASAAADADPDFDGMPNGVEYILGGNPGVAAASPPGPAVSATDGNLRFLFPRDDKSETPGVTLTVESGIDLAAWPAVFTIGPNTAASSSGVTIAENGDAPDTITVTIPPGTATRRFARLRVTIAP